MRNYQINNPIVALMHNRQGPATANPDQRCANRFVNDLAKSCFDCEMNQISRCPFLVAFNDQSTPSPANVPVGGCNHERGHLLQAL